MTYTLPNSFPVHTSCAHDRRRGFSLIELLVVIAIIGVLSAILIPVVGHVKENARSSTCASNQRQIALGLNLYAQDHDGMFPTFKATGGGNVKNWRQQIYDYVIDPDTNRDKHYIWYCPSKSDSDEDWRDTGSYGTNLNLSGSTLFAVQYPAETMAVIDTTLSQGHHAKSDNSSSSSVERWVHFRHGGDTANMAMLDGHVETIHESELEERVLPAFNPSKPKK